ncbi:MAG TPA: DUF1345 domain-containing protein [Rubrobacteraceae bacterium]|nr:DUF1345 domain-containing protein [Rubrobacteraceae bacterium]
MSKSARVLERLIRWASSLKDLRRVLTAALIALIVVYVLQPWGGDVELELVTLWDAWAVSYLGLTGLLIIRSSIQQTRQWALDERIPPRPHLSLLRSVILRVLQVLFLASRTSSLFFIVLVSLVGLVLAISLSPHVRDLETARGVSVVVLDALGVVSAWGVLHISYALHYAYLYYRSEESAGGLAFPGEQSPKQLDFAYFAFTIGTSFAVSDVAVTDPAIRQAVLGHQILSFFYNTSILALVINLVTG